jgi:enterochelin esterase-like enzyme
METLLERARREGTPLIDDTGEGTDAQVMFVWEGETVPTLAGDFNGWGHDPERQATFTEVETGVWTYTIRLPRNGYYEYLYTSDPEDPKGRMNDPLNKRRITNGMGKFNNYFDMPQATHTKLVKLRKGVPQGRVTHHQITHDFLLGRKKRDVWLYAPPVDQPVPLIVVYDGRDYYKRAKLSQIVDNLIADNRIDPVALAMVENGRESRFLEYTNSEITLMMVVQVLLPLANEHLNLLDLEGNPGLYGVLGASLGGLMAMYTALRLPTIFGKVLSQSGSYLFDFGTGNSITEMLVRTLPPLPLTIWQDVGEFEWLLHTNRHINNLLKEKGYNVTYREYPGGHNYTSWRDQLPDALVATFGRQ